MTTIEEETMDEFFDFEDAAHPMDHEMDFSGLTSGPYDADLAFVQQQADENHFTCLQHFSVPDEFHNTMADTSMMGPADFTDFPRWIDGMENPVRPCAYCQRMRIHCKVLKEGLRKGSCTSCVALARSCSLTHPPAAVDHSNTVPFGEQFCVPNTVEDVGEFDVQMQACQYCFGRGLNCKVITEGENIGSCMNCVSLACDCRPRTQENFADWKLEDLMDLNQPLQAPGTSLHSRSGSNSNLVSLQSSDDNMNASFVAPKVGARFSRESIRILRGWLSTHHAHPYPTDEEKESLIHQTGLNKTQITGWLANARRRGKVRAPRSTSPSVHNYADAIDIPRRSTPALQNMNPLERWKNSPPENEPASVTAIAKAVTSSTYSSGMDSPSLDYGHTDDGSARSLWNVSSASSLGTSHGTSHSSGSFASAFSHKSRGSMGSFGSMGNRGRRRRRRQAPKAIKLDMLMNAPTRTFQCTFCTETFKTKHDWQRHEKSLHLSLERWVCSPDGPTRDGCCVYCGLVDAPADHAEMHNHSSCVEKSLEERTFYRKDHLRQHLNLVHDVKFQGLMESWKVATPEIRSRCGFCGIIMDSWTIRVDHLAEHFKSGKSMADWKGDWGFEPQVLDIVENGMPPYLIHDERKSPNPYQATKETAIDKKLSDFVKIGLVEYVHERVMSGVMPTDADLLAEARKVVQGADRFIVEKKHHAGSWFRDLILLWGTDENQSPTGSPHPRLRNGLQDDGLDIPCTKHKMLMDFVQRKVALGLTPIDHELQVECCRIMDEDESKANFKSKPAVAWFKYLITSSSCWLRAFRRRAGLPRSSEIGSEQIRSLDDKTIDYSIHNRARLEHELKAWIGLQMAVGQFPSDGDIQSQARMIVYKNDDPWNQTAIDDPAILHLVKRQTGLIASDDYGLEPVNLPTLSEVSEPSRSLHWDFEGAATLLPTNIADGSISPPILEPTPQLPHAKSKQPLKYFLNDANCYGRLVRELSRFVTTSMSPNNPNQHTPSDAELQNQARWLIYDDDDPWNQTPADNAEWLIRFKRDIGLAANEGPGLEIGNPSWRLTEGGTGWSPPYLLPQASPAFTADVPVTIAHKTYNIKATTAEKFAKGLSERWEKPGQIFCSRQLEHELGQYVKAEMAGGRCPLDEELRGQARRILNMDATPADDYELLQKFKAMHGIPVPATMPLLDDALLAEFDHELQTMDLSTILTTSNSSGSSPDGNCTANFLSTPKTDNTTNTFGIQRSKGDGLAVDYAELYRVHAATASPLRRRASSRMAAQAGFNAPISPPKTTTQLSSPQEEFMM